MSSPPVIINSTSAILKACSTIVCVGRNYANHAKELGNEIPSSPLLFFKPKASLLPPSSSSALPIVYSPSIVSSLHHEVEIALVINKPTANISPSAARHHVAGIVLALDMTARNLQDSAKKKGTPWSFAKGLDTFCPISNFVPIEQLPATFLQYTGEGSSSSAASTPAARDGAGLESYCLVDGVEKQRGSSSSMIFSPALLLSYISCFFSLSAGDLVLLGTPEGVGEVKIGSRIKAGIKGFEEQGALLHVEVKRKPEAEFFILPSKF